jgi:hypothetical protein
MKQHPFTLQRHRWYAMQVILPSGGQEFSPIWIYDVLPQQTGKKLLQLSFWHANYPEGVRNKVYDLHVLRRTSWHALNAKYAGYLMAERKLEEKKQVILLTAVTAEWVETHFRMTPEGDLQEWLDLQCPHPTAGKLKYRL